MIYSEQARGWITVLFKRSDGERLVLGVDEYEFLEDQKLFAANRIQNDVIEAQGTDGEFLAGQVRRAEVQSFDGFVGDAGTPRAETERLRMEFIRFFQPRKFFEAIYIFPNASAIKRGRGFIVDAPEVEELWQRHPQYHVALGFEDVDYFEYLESPSGEEIFGHEQIIPLAENRSGGLVWNLADETQAAGTLWDSQTQTPGAVWDSGTALPDTINVAGVAPTYPVITVSPYVKNLVIENRRNATILRWSGTVGSGQRLVLDCRNQTAKLSGTNVLDRLTGDWVRLDPGENRIAFTADSGGTGTATFEWLGVVG